MSTFHGRYTQEFKDAAVRSVVDNARSVADVARELGLVEQTLRNWVSAYRVRSETTDVDELTVPERAQAMDR